MGILIPAGEAALPVDPDDLVYVIETVAGSDLVGDNGPALEAQFGDARGVAADREGNVYVADPGNHRVRKVTPEGVISTVAGTGRPGYGGDNGPGQSAQLNAPYGVAVDASGNLYIADTYNHRVRKVDRDGRITTVAGSGQKGSLETGDALTAQLMTPRNVACDSAGNLYIAEFEGHRIRKVTVADGRIQTVAGNGIAGYGGDSASAVAAQLDHPAGIAVDGAGVLYIADTGNRRLRRVTAGAISTVLKMEWSDGITAVAVNPIGLVTVSDQPGLIRQRNGRGLWEVIGGTGQSTYNGDGNSALVTNLAPTALAFDSYGDLLVAERRRIRRVVTGLVYSVAGDGTFGFRGDGGPAAVARLSGPEGLAFDRSGNLLVADRWNCRVLRVTGGTLQLVSSRCGSGTGTSGAAENIPLFHPRGAASDRAGNVFISDTEYHRVLKVSPNGSVATYAGNGSRGYAGDGGRANTAQLDSPAGIALDEEGSLYIADTGNNRIRKVSASGDIGTVAGTGEARFGGDGGPAHLAGLNQPEGVVVDSAGNLYIADTLNQRIRRVGPGGTIETIAGNGLQGYAGDGGRATSAQLFHPGYMVIGKEGSLYFTDQSNDRVRALRPHSRLADPLDTLAVVNAASMQPGPVAPGEIVSVFGTAIGPKDGAGARLGPDGLLETSLGDSQVLFDGQPAPLFWVEAGQINAQVPYAVAGSAETQVEVIYKGYSRGKTTLQVADAAPGLFAVPGDPGRGVIINEDWSVNSTTNPAERNSLITLYATGEGQTDPAGQEGKPASQPLPQPRLPVSLTISGLPTEVLYAGPAPGFCGLMQINARVPGRFLPSGVLPVVLKVGTMVSQPGVQIAIQ